MANALAAHLADKGHDVHIVTGAPIIGVWMTSTLEQPRMIAELKASGVSVYPNSTATSWENGALHIVRSDTGNRVDPILGSTLISVTNRMQDDELSRELHGRDMPQRTIGDAEVPGTIQAAVYSGHRHARELLGSEPADRIFKRERHTRQQVRRILRQVSRESPSSA